MKIIGKHLLLRPLWVYIDLGSLLIIKLILNKVVKFYDRRVVALVSRAGCFEFDFRNAGMGEVCEYSMASLKQIKL